VTFFGPRNLVPHWRRQLWGTGTRSPLEFQLFNFLITSEPHKLRVSDIGLYVVAYPEKNIQAYIFVTVYCMNLSALSPQFFSPSFLPLLAQNPGDATAVPAHFNQLLIIIMIMIRQFIRRRNISMKSLQGRRTPGSRDDCRTAPDGRRHLDQANGLEPLTCL